MRRTVRALAAAVLAMAAPQAAQANAVVSVDQLIDVQVVTYSLGGLLSGPTRIRADLGRQRLDTATAPPGAHGDGAGVRTTSLPVTESRALTGEQVRDIREHAIALLKAGPVDPARCAPTADAVGRLDVVANDETHTYTFSMACQSDAERGLVNAILCARQPDQPVCTRP